MHNISVYKQSFPEIRLTYRLSFMPGGTCPLELSVQRLWHKKQYSCFGIQKNNDMLIFIAKLYREQSNVSVYIFEYNQWFKRKQHEFDNMLHVQFKFVSVSDNILNLIDTISWNHFACKIFYWFLLTYACVQHVWIHIFFKYYTEPTFI